MIRDIFRTYRQAFRIVLRRFSRPISLEEAEERRLLWSKSYLFFSLGAILTATYMTFTESMDFDYNKDLGRKEAVITKLYGDRTDKVRVIKPFSDSVEYDLTSGVAKVAEDS